MRQTNLLCLSVLKYLDSKYLPFPSWRALDNLSYHRSSPKKIKKLKQLFIFKKTRMAKSIKGKLYNQT